MKQNRVSYSKPIPVKLNPETLARLDVLSKRMGEPRSVVMRLAMRIGMDGLEKAFETPGVSAASLLAAEAAKYPEHQAQYSTTEDRPNAGPGAKGKKEKDIDRRLAAAVARDVSKSPNPPGGRK